MSGVVTEELARELKMQVHLVGDILRICFMVCLLKCVAMPLLGFLQEILFIL